MGSLIFLRTEKFLCRKMAQIPRNMLTNATNLKENGFRIIRSMRNNTWYSSICYNLFQASQKLCRADKNHKLLAWHGKLVLKLILVPGERIDFAAAVGISRVNAVIL